MTTDIQATEPSAAPDGDGIVAGAGERQDWGDIAREFAGIVAGDRFDRGDLAALRRMDPDEYDAAAFYRLMASRDLLGSPEVERKWALILHGIALMTRTAGGSAAARSAHDGGMPVGRALFEGGDAGRSSAYYSESRFNRLLTARGDMARTLLARMFRMMAAAGQPFNWREMARLKLNDGYDESRAENARRYIARQYYQAERRNARTSQD